MQLAKYLAELKKIELLKEEEEQRLWESYKNNGDMDARQRLIESYQPLVFKQASSYLGYENIMDVVQEGLIGLIEAVESYDITKGVAFSLYAVHRVRGRMKNFLSKEGASDIACIEAANADGSENIKDSIVDTSPSTTEQAEMHELTSRVMTAMDRLPAKEKAVLEGIYLKSATANEVASILDVSAAHIYRLQKSGIRRVRGMLARFIHNW